MANKTCSTYLGTVLLTSNVYWQDAVMTRASNHNVDIYDSSNDTWYLYGANKKSKCPLKF